MTELLLKEEVYAIVGAAIDVHKELGPGFNEAVYQEAFEIELRLRDIAFEPQKNLKIQYKNEILERDYFADVVCYGKIVVELKALDNLTSKEEAQILHYLKASQMKVGLLINFGSRAKLEWKRFVYRSTKYTKEHQAHPIPSIQPIHASYETKEMIFESQDPFSVVFLSGSS